MAENQDSVQVQELAFEDLGDDFFKCGKCEQTKPTDDASMLDGGGAVCEICAHRHNYVSCESCLYFFQFAELRLVCGGCFNGSPNTVTGVSSGIQEQGGITNPMTEMRGVHQ